MSTLRERKRREDELLEKGRAPCPGCGQLVVAFITYTIVSPAVPDGRRVWSECVNCITVEATPPRVALRDETSYVESLSTERRS